MTKNEISIVDIFYEYTQGNKDQAILVNSHFDTNDGDYVDGWFIGTVESIVGHVMEWAYTFSKKKKGDNYEFYFHDSPCYVDDVFDVLAASTFFTFPNPDTLTFVQEMLKNNTGFTLLNWEFDFYDEEKADVDLSLPTLMKKFASSIIKDTRKDIEQRIKNYEKGIADEKRHIEKLRNGELGDWEKKYYSDPEKLAAYIPKLEESLVNSANRVKELQAQLDTLDKVEKHYESD